MKLSENLTMSEVTKSSTAIRRGINNTPNDEKIIENLRILAKEVFQPVRDFFNKPIFISSGYRGYELNKYIGGSKNSQHCTGQAIDIDQDNRNSTISNSDIFNYIKDNLVFDQLIWEFGDEHNPAWVHVSYDECRNRGQILEAYSSEGRTKYKKYER